MSYSKESNGFVALLDWSKSMTSRVGHPEKLLRHLLDATHYQLFANINAHESRTREQLRRDDHYFTGHLLIEQLIPVWYAGKPNVHELLAEGLLDVLSYCGYEGLLNFLNCALVGFGLYSERCQWNLSGLNQFADMLDLLKSIVASVEEYEAIEASGKTTTALQAA